MRTPMILSDMWLCADAWRVASSWYHQLEYFKPTTTKYTFEQTEPGAASTALGSTLQTIWESSVTTKMITERAPWPWLYSKPLFTTIERQSAPGTTPSRANAAASYATIPSGINCWD